MQIISRDRLARAKKSFATRRVPERMIKTLLTDLRRPRIGDLVLARVTGLGSHRFSELESGRKASLFPGDEVVLAYGNRYAPDQYEAYVPDDLAPCHMVAAGGIAATATAWHDRLGGPTAIEPLGLLGGGNAEPLNLADFALPEIAGPLPQNVFAVFGTAMNAGKSTTAANLVKGFAELGHKVGTAKVTGTGAGGDLWLMRDSGAQAALDFTDTGMPSTFGVAYPRLLAATMTLLRTLRASGCTVAILEVADGLYQEETAAFARSDAFISLLSATFFAAYDAMGATSGARRLTELGHRVAGVSGAFTRSPLAMREAAALGLNVLSASDLCSGRTVRPFLNDAQWDRGAVAKGL